MEPRDRVDPENQRPGVEPGVLTELEIDDAEPGGTATATRKAVEQRFAAALQLARRALAELLDRLPQHTRSELLSTELSDPRERCWNLRDLGVCCVRLDEQASEAEEPVLREIACRAREIRLRVNRARDELVLVNLAFVAHVARPFRRSSVSFGDLVQEGTIGLMEAVDRFQPELGFRFPTYAVWRIRRALSRALGERYRFIRLPDHVRLRARDLRLATDELRDTLHREPTLDEIAGATGVSSTRIDKLHGVLGEPGPLERTDHANRAKSPLRFTADARSPDPLADTLRAELHDRLAWAVQQLPPRERSIIRMRFGLGNCPRRTLEQIGRALKLSRERVRQIELAALSSIGSHLRDAGLETEDETWSPPCAAGERRTTVRRGTKQVPGTRPGIAPSRL